MSSKSLASTLCNVLLVFFLVGRWLNLNKKIIFQFKALPIQILQAEDDMAGEIFSANSGKT